MVAVVETVKGALGLDGSAASAPTAVACLHVLRPNSPPPTESAPPTAPLGQRRTSVVATMRRFISLNKWMLYVLSWVILPQHIEENGSRKPQEAPNNAAKRSCEQTK